MHRICAALASLLIPMTPVMAADLDHPLLMRVEHGVNVWAPPPLPLVPAAPSVISQQTRVQVIVIDERRKPRDGYAHGERWPGYLGHYPARLPF